MMPSAVPVLPFAKPDVAVSTGIDYRTLPFVEATVSGIKSLPAKRGVYIVATKEGKVLYVGQTKNFAARWLAHGKKRFAQKVGAVIHYFELPETSDLEAVERAFVDLLSPEWNGRQRGLDEELGVITRAMTRVNIFISGEQIERLKSLAKGRPYAELIRQAIEEFLLKHGV